VGLISSVKDLLTELVEKGTWLNPKLISKVLIMAKEE
jgi:predicted nucleic acid-binding protein